MYCDRHSSVRFCLPSERENKRLFENFLVPEKLNVQLEHTLLFKSGAIAFHYKKNE
jgi:hypothetical protein